MNQSVAIIGGGVSGLTCAALLAEHGCRTAIFAREAARKTTSGAAAALWFPYHVEPAERVIPLALETYHVLVQLTRFPDSGVTMIELRQFSRTTGIQIPDWSIPLGAQSLASAAAVRRPAQNHAEYDSQSFKSGFSLRVPLMDTTIYLEYLAARFRRVGGQINADVQVDNFEDVDRKFDLVVNCAGIGARELAKDSELEPHRGQVAIVPRLEGSSCAIVCDDAPLMYAIPRASDCVFGGTNELSDNLTPDSETTSRIVAECSRSLHIDEPRVLAERVGLRPFRKTGLRLESDRLRDGRVVIHNYGHGGAGFTLSWGCAREVFDLVAGSASVGNGVLPSKSSCRSGE